MTEQARDGLLDPVIGRENEIQETAEILSRRTKNNAILVGDAGVGKTAVVEGLAQAIVAGKVPETIQDKEIYSIDLSSLEAGTQYRGSFEENIKQLVEEVKAVILFYSSMKFIRFSAQVPLVVKMVAKDWLISLNLLCHVAS